MKISQMVFNLQSRHECMVEMALFNLHRAITPKVGKPVLRSIYSARCLMMLYVYVTFRKKISRTVLE